MPAAEDAASSGRTSRNTVWIANQIARLRTTPTTAAVIAESAPASALLPRMTSMNGAPRKIQRKHGMKVTQVASSPPSTPAVIGESVPGSRWASHEAHELQDHDQRAGRGLGHHRGASEGETP